MILHYRRLWLSLAWIWLLVIITLSLISVPKVAAFSIPYIDKVEHAFSYFVLMFLFSQCYKKMNIRLGYSIFFIIIGITLEILQSFTVTRLFEYSDMIANTSGVIAGLMLADTRLSRIVQLLDKKLNITFNS